MAMATPWPRAARAPPPPNEQFYFSPRAPAREENFDFLCSGAPKEPAEQRCRGGRGGQGRDMTPALPSDLLKSIGSLECYKPVESEPKRGEADLIPQY